MTGRRCYFHATASDHWPTVREIFGAVIALMALDLSGYPRDVSCSNQSLLWIDFGSWGVAVSVLALFLIL